MITQKKLLERINELQKRVNMLVLNFDCLWSRPEIQKMRDELHDRRLKKATQCNSFIPPGDKDQPEYNWEDCEIEGLFAPCYYMWYGHCPHEQIPDEGGENSIGNCPHCGHILYKKDLGHKK